MKYPIICLLALSISGMACMQPAGEPDAQQAATDKLTDTPSDDLGSLPGAYYGGEDSQLLTGYTVKLGIASTGESKMILTFNTEGQPHEHDGRCILHGKDLFFSSPDRTMHFIVGFENTLTYAGDDTTLSDLVLYQR